MRVAVTGAAGSLGRQLVSLLRTRPGIATLVALDRAPFPSPSDPSGSAAVESHTCDVRDEDIGRFFAGCDAVVHLAFIVEHGSRDAEQTEAINVGGSRNVFEAATAAGVRRFVYASSVAAYGAWPENDGVLLSEDAPRRGNPEFYYARHKAAVEAWLDGFEAAHPELRIARLRPTIFLSESGARPVGGLRLPVQLSLPGPEGRLQITHEADVAEAFALAIERGAHGAFNVAVDDAGLTPREMARELGRPTLVIPGFLLALYRFAWRHGVGDVDPIWVDFGRGRTLVVSNQKIRRELSWNPRFPTSGEVLRRVAGRPNARASKTARAFFRPLVRMTRLLGSLPASEKQRAEGRGLRGEVNLRLTGEEPSEWRFRLDDGRLGVREGASDAARATVTIRDVDFRGMLSGRVDATVAQMTGKVRMRGDGEMGLLVGGLIGGFRKLRDARGWRGWPARRYARRVLRHEQP
jgi:nucleoside-diphosphate-sugar epimerase/putative sterol carrier protein